MAKIQPPFTVSAPSADASLLPVAALPRLIESFLMAGDIDQHSNRTLDSRRDRLSKFCWYLENVSGASQVDVHQIRQFLHYLRHGDPKNGGCRWGKAGLTKPCSAGTVKSYHSTLRTFFNWLVAEGEIPVSPMDRIPTPVDRPDQVQPFTETELRALHAAAKRGRSAKGERRGSPRRDEAIFLMLLDTGMRASELCALTRADVSLSDGQVRIRHGKGDKGRTIPFSRDTKRALMQYLQTRESDPNDLLFLSERGRYAGEGLTRNGLLQLVERWVKIAGIETASGRQCSPHTFRHTFAIMFLRAGGNVFTLKEILGHSSLAIVNRYVALAEADITRQHAQFSPVSSLTTASRRGSSR